ncbi:MAG: tetratricopeptide repeat protein, partial [Anaerolineales bacterium]|nr:tetratricopeptide repeat protein [Anaerolineales bacterium]
MDHSIQLSVTPDNLVLPTPVPTSTPILPPLQSTIPGDVYYFYGDWESSIASYEDMLGSDSSPDQISAALLGLGKVYFQKQDYQKALDYLRLLVSTYPDSTLVHKGYFALAETYTALN